jgi:hypothetical protein
VVDQPEAGEDREHEQHAGDDHHGLAPEAIRQQAAERFAAHREPAIEDEEAERDRRRQVQRVERVGRHVVQRVAADRARGQHHEPEYDDGEIRSRASRVLRVQGCALRRGLVGMRAAQRLGQRAPQHDPEGHDRRAEQHRGPPAPIRQLLRAEVRGQQCADDAGHEDRGVLRRVLHGQVEPAAVRRRRLCHERGGRAHLAAEREALHEPEHQQEDGCDGADRRVRRRQRQAHDGHAHEREREHHRRLAADAIAHAPDHDRPDRSREEPGAERGENGEEARGRSPARIERARDVDGEIRESEEVVELEPVADEDGHHVPQRDASRRRTALQVGRAHRPLPPQWSTPS